MAGQYGYVTSRYSDTLSMYTSSAEAKYCDEHVRVYVCLSARISPERHARHLPIFVAVTHRRGLVLLRAPAG